MYQKTRSQVAFPLDTFRVREQCQCPVLPHENKPLHLTVQALHRGRKDGRAAEQVDVGMMVKNEQSYPKSPTPDHD